MIQIIEENKRRRPSIAQALMGGLAEGLPGAIEKYQGQKLAQQNMQQENEAAKKMGIDLSGVKDPKVRQEMWALALQGKNQQDLAKQKYEQDLASLGKEQEFKKGEAAQKAMDDFNRAQELQHQKYGYEQQLQDKKPDTKATDFANKEKENRAPLNAGLKTLDAMRQILKKGNLGILSSGKGLFSGETRQDRAKYSQLGKSLISLASNIPIRNQMEFETLAHDLYNPNNTDETNSGILDAMEGIIKQNLQQYEGNLQEISDQPEQKQSLQEIFG